MGLKMPTSWSAKASATEIKTEVKAKLEMGADVAGLGLCPDCQVPMERVMHGENEVAVCVADRIVLPLKDTEDGSVPEAQV